MTFLGVKVKILNNSGLYPESLFAVLNFGLLQNFVESRDRFRFDLPFASEKPRDFFLRLLLKQFRIFTVGIGFAILVMRLVGFFSLKSIGTFSIGSVTQV